MIYILEAFKEKRIRRLLIMIAIFGFLFIFFYRVLVVYDFSKIDFKVDLSEQLVDKRLFLLSGWDRERKANEERAIWSNAKSSMLVFLLPHKSTYQIRFKLLFLQKGLTEVFVNKKLLTTFKSRETGKWQDFQFVIPHDLISKGFNKIGFVNLSKTTTPVGYKDLRITNYQRMPLTFPSGYGLFDEVRWLSGRKGVNVNWLFCLFGGFLMPVFWVVYSIWFFSLSGIKFSRILLFDFFTYLPSIIILLAIYLSSRLFLYIPAFTRGNFLLFTIGLASGTKAYQLYRYAQRPKINAQIKFLKDVVGKEIVGTMFIVGFMILLFICAFFLILKQENIAEKVGNGAYLLLAIGLILRLIQSFRERWE